MTKIMYRIGFALFILFLSTNVYSQDVHYSQRMAGDRQRNPTFLNYFEGNWQAMTVYRSQWQSIGVPFNSSSILFTKKIITAIPTLQFFGGVAFTNDKSGDAKLTANRFGLNIGAEYELPLGKVSLAFSNAYAAKSFDQNGLTFPSQYDRGIGGFNGDLASGENFKGEQTGFFDLGVGINFQRKLTQKWDLVSGLSIEHLTEPNESFFDNDNTKNRGYGVQLLATHYLNTKFNVYPYLSFYRAKGASEMLLGSALKLNSSSFGPINSIKPFVYFRTGVDRLSDAFILGSSAEIGDFQLGISYDVNVSELEFASNYKGGFELTLIYTAKNPKLTQKRIPCERY